PINYFEAIFAIILRLILSLISDFVITSSLIGRAVFADSNFWWSYLVVVLAMLIFHKKQHVEIRNATK
ncbi:MAG TPA: hypothetical protein PKD79_03045, partial [Candidatus Doudnabacteria bacterium]|nr:hypothetical protein [Candidatus Doudnabacteria bacterium]